MDKHEVAHILEEMGTLLTLKGENPFKIRAYYNAARAIENLEADLVLLVEQGKLEELPGIGAKIGQKITLLVTTGRLPEYEKLQKSVPKGLLQLLHVPGLGGKKIKLLYEKLKIKGASDLIEACRRGKIAQLAGFGKKTQANILNGLERIKSYGKRTLWWNAKERAQPILDAFSKLKGVSRVELAGSFRRKLETVGDLDFIVASSTPIETIHWFTSQPWVAEVLAQGPTKSSVRSKDGIQMDLRVVPEKEFPYALLYFTGSKAHNIKLRARANKKELLLNEYGLEQLKPRRGKKPKKALDEEGIYRSLGLAYIPPELREDMGEIEAAEQERLPHLIEEREIRGIFHCHTTDSDGHNTLVEMVAAAEKLKWEYLGISDHSKSSVQAHGMDEKRLQDQIHRIRTLNRSKKFSTHIFAGLECDILTDGKLDFPNSVLKELDFVIVSVHRSFTLDEKAMTRRMIRAIENPYTTMLGHLTGRLLLRREGYKVNPLKLIDACIANKKIIELNAHPMRLDMDWRLWHTAKERGLMCSINPDAHDTQGLQHFRAGVNIARKGWLEKSDVFNTRSLTEVRKYLARRHALKKI